jgi:hypothetical protein
MLKNIPGYQIVLLVGALIITGMTLYPPWRVSLHLNNREMSQPYCWAYLFSPPDAPDSTRLKTSNQDSAGFSNQIIREFFPERLSTEHETMPWTSRFCVLQIDFTLLFMEYFIVILPAGALAAFFYFAANRKREE